jgi:RNA polymerase sigma-70 factor (ECF subfamily)
MPARDESEATALFQRGAFAEAATWVLRAYGPEVMTYLMSLERAPDEARDVFSDFCVALWESLPRFRGDCSFRTYAYVLARRQWARSVRTRMRRRAEVPLSPEAEAVAAEVRTSTAEYLRSEARDRLLKLRAELDEDDHTLLVLRLHRKLAWHEIARVMYDGDDEPAEAELTRHAATLRKRYERLKEQFRRELRGAGAD